MLYLGIFRHECQVLQQAKRQVFKFNALCQKKLMKLMVKMLFCPEARIYHHYVAVQLE